jgi:hypothetical protein
MKAFLLSAHVRGMQKLEGYHNGSIAMQRPANFQTEVI